jgi:hypothetical protein
MLALVSLCAIATQAFAQGPFTSLIFGAGARSGAGLLGRGLFAEAAAAEGAAARGAMRSFSGMGRGWLAAEEGVIAAESRAFAPMSRGFFRSGGSRFGTTALAAEEGVIAAESRLATRGAMRGMSRGGLLAAEEGVIAAETRVLAHPMSRAGGSLFRRGGGGGLLSAEAEAAVAAETRIASHPMARSASIGSGGGGGSIRSGALIEWNPVNGPGPLGSQAANFRSATYAEMVTTEETILYRTYSDPSKAMGSWWTRQKPQGPLQSVIDSAIDQNWGNAATQTVKVRVPAGTRIFEGVAAPQRGLVGGGNQIFLPSVNPAWVIK